METRGSCRAERGQVPSLHRPGKPLNRLSGRGSGRGRGRERTQHVREETIRPVRQASISRDERDRRYASFESDFLVEKLMGIDTLPPIRILVTSLGLILAAYRRFANSSRYPQSLSGRSFRGANVHFPWSGGELFYSRLVRCGFASNGVGRGAYHRSRIRQESSGH